MCPKTVLLDNIYIVSPLRTLFSKVTFIVRCSSHEEANIASLLVKFKASVAFLPLVIPR